VREPLAELLDQDLRVEISPGLWVTAAGGVLLVVGGVLGLAWLHREGRSESVGVEAAEGAAG
jgi:hypothetical protein